MAVISRALLASLGAASGHLSCGLSTHVSRPKAPVYTVAGHGLVQRPGTPYLKGTRVGWPVAYDVAQGWDMQMPAPHMLRAAHFRPLLHHALKDPYDHTLSVSLPTVLQESF